MLICGSLMHDKAACTLHVRRCMELAGGQTCSGARNFATLLITNHNTEARNDQRVSIQNVLRGTKADGIVIMAMMLTQSEIVIQKVKS